MACTDETPTISAPRLEQPVELNPRPFPNAPLNRLSSTGDDIESMDDYFARVSDSIPGFAGMYYDDAGDMVIRLTSKGEAAGARAKLSAVTGRPASVRKRNAPPGVKVREAKNDYRTLQRWKRWANRQLLGTKGVVLTDIDEVNNRLRIGVLDEQVAGRVREAAERQNIEVDVAVMGTEDITGASLSAAVVPGFLASAYTEKPGGIMIENHLPGNQTCSLGFNAKLSSNQRRIYDSNNYFVTNAHCTSALGGTEFTLFFQPTKTASPSAFAVEVREPLYGQYPSRPDCPIGFRCSMADAALVQHNAFDRPEWAKVARTTFAGTGSQDGSVAIDPNAPRWLIKDSVEFVFRNQEVDKVGTNSGWTYGLVSGTCQDINLFLRDVQTTFVMLCSYTADATVRGGDSGGPVFILRDLSRSQVSIAGLIFAGGSSRARFSLYPHISYELTHRDHSTACPDFTQSCWPRLTVSTTTGFNEQDGGGGGSGGGGGPGDPPPFSKVTDKRPIRR